MPTVYGAVLRRREASSLPMLATMGWFARRAAVGSSVSYLYSTASGQVLKGLEVEMKAR